MPNQICDRALLVKAVVSFVYCVETTHFFTRNQFSSFLVVNMRKQTHVCTGFKKKIELNTQSRQIKQNQRRWSSELLGRVSVTSVHLNHNVP